MDTVNSTESRAPGGVVDWRRAEFMLTLLGFAAFVAAAPAQALSMQECSAKYKAAKDGGTLNGQKWNDFRKAQCAADATPAAAPAAVERQNRTFMRSYGCRWAPMRPPSKEQRRRCRSSSER